MHTGLNGKQRRLQKGDVKNVSENANFLKENKANLILKYDSIRENNKYTFILFDTEKKDRIFGGDTD